MVAAGALLSGSRTAVGPRQAGPEVVVENRQAE
jgi:hypothetical protein